MPVPAEPVASVEPLAEADADTGTCPLLHTNPLTHSRHSQPDGVSAQPSGVASDNHA